MRDYKILEIGNIIDRKGVLFFVKDIDLGKGVVYIEPIVFGADYQEYPPRLYTLPFETLQIEHYHIEIIDNVLNKRSWEHFVETGLYLPEQMINGAIYRENKGKWEYVQKA